MTKAAHSGRSPSTVYRTVSPETWRLIRGAYLSGLSAPTVAARFGVSEGAIRKRARREGWTKRLYAAQATPWSGPASAWPDAKTRAGPADALVADAEEEALLRHWRAPLRIRPNDLARKALAGAAEAVKSGQGLTALRLSRAAAEIARLDGLLDWAEADLAEDEARQADHQRTLMLFVREKALSLAKGIAAGRGLPPEYQDVEAYLARLEQQAVAAGEADDA